MEVRPPPAETLQIVPDRLGVGVENMRSVFMHQNPGIIHRVIGVAGNMVPAVHDQDPLVSNGGDPFGERCTCETGADNDPVIHVNFYSLAAGRTKGRPVCGLSSFKGSKWICQKSVEPIIWRRSILKKSFLICWFFGGLFHVFKWESAMRSPVDCGPLTIMPFNSIPA